MPEGITGAVWAFCWGLAAASGVLGGTMPGLIAQPPHRPIAAIMSFGAGVLLSAASIKIASEALIVAGAVLSGGGIIAGAAMFSIANAALATAKDRKRCGECKPPRPEAEAPGSGTSIALCTALHAVPEALVPGGHPSDQRTGCGTGCGARALERAGGTFGDGRDATCLPLIYLRPEPMERYCA